MKTKTIKQKKKQIEKEKDTNKSKGFIIFALLCIVIFYPPFFRGLFFQREILITHIVSFLLFSIYLIRKLLDGERISIDRPFDIIGLLLILAYILPIATFRWANLRTAIGHGLRYINFFVIYLMVKDYASESKFKNIIIDVIIGTGVVTAIIGLLAAAGYVNYTDAVLGGNRISSTFQYPNTLAAFMMTLFFLTSTKQSLEEKLCKKNLYAVSGYIMLVTFIFTYSRGAWLLFLIFALFYFLVIRGEDKIKLLLYLIAAGISSLLILQPFMSQTASTGDRNIRVIGTVVVGIIIFSLMYNGLQLMIEKLQGKQKIIYSLVGVIVAGALAFTLVAINATVPLVFDNINQVENRNNSIIRLVDSIESNEEYVLRVSVDGFSEVEEHWPWRILIDSVNEEALSSRLEQILGSDSSNGILDFPFATLEDTEHLRITFTNLYPNTSVTFYNASILDKEENLIEEIRLGYKYIPETLIERIESIGVNERSASARLDFYRDSFRIFRDYPVFGAGGGAWNSLYPMYQTSPYFTTEAHNYFLEVLVETGVFGTLIVILLLITILLILVNSVKKKNNLNTTIAIAIFSLLAHSALDFNFSYLSMPIYLWALLGLLNNERIGDIKLLKFNRELSSIIGLIAILPLLFVSISLFEANRIGEIAIKDIRSGNVAEGINGLERAVSRDRFNSEIRNIYADILISYASNTGKHHMFDRAEEVLLNAKRYEPNNINTIELLSRLYIHIAEFDLGIEYANKLIETIPMRDLGYEYKALLYMSLGDHFIKEGEESKAFEMYRNTLNVIEDIKRTNERADVPIPLSENALMHINKARYIGENKNDLDLFDFINRAAFIAYLDIDVNNDGLTDGWRSWQNANANLKTKTSERGLTISNNGKNLGVVYSQSFSLEANTEYVLEFLLEGNIERDFIVVMVASRNGTYTQMAERVNKRSEDNVYSFTFRSRADIESGRQYLRFDHLGNSDESFLLKRAIIYESEREE